MPLVSGVRARWSSLIHPWSSWHTTSEIPSKVSGTRYNGSHQTCQFFTCFKCRGFMKFLCFGIDIFKFQREWMWWHADGMHRACILPPSFFPDSGSMWSKVTLKHDIPTSQHHLSVTSFRHRFAIVSCHLVDLVDVHTQKQKLRITSGEEHGVKVYKIVPHTFERFSDSSLQTEAPANPHRIVGYRSDVPRLEKLEHHISDVIRSYESWPTNQLRACIDHALACMEKDKIYKHVTKTCETPFLPVNSVWPRRWMIDEFEPRNKFSVKVLDPGSKNISSLMQCFLHDLHGFFSLLKGMKKLGILSDCKFRHNLTKKRTKTSRPLSRHQSAFHRLKDSRNWFNDSLKTIGFLCLCVTLIFLRFRCFFAASHEWHLLAGLEASWRS